MGGTFPPSPPLTKWVLPHPPPSRGDLNLTSKSTFMRINLLVCGWLSRCKTVSITDSFIRNCCASRILRINVAKPQAWEKASVFLTAKKKRGNIYCYRVIQKTMWVITPVLGRGVAKTPLTVLAPVLNPPLHPPPPKKHMSRKNALEDKGYAFLKTFSIMYP